MEIEGCFFVRLDLSQAYSPGGQTGHHGVGSPPPNELVELLASGAVEVQAKTSSAAKTILAMVFFILSP